MFSLLSNKKGKSSWMFFSLSSLLCIFLLSGCRNSLLDTKTFDEPASTDSSNVNSKLKSQFFEIPDGIRPEFKEILLSIQAQDQVNQFVTQDWVAQNGIPIWDKIFSPTASENENSLGTRSSRTVKDMSFIPLKDTVTQEIKSFIAVYKLEGNTYGYRFYNKQALLNFFPPNNDVKKKIISTLTVFGFFEENINGKKNLKLPSPYNKTIKEVKIKITKASDNLTARSSCSEVCFHWTTDIALMQSTESQCFTICSYDGPIMNSDPFGGSTSCSRCGGGLGSTSSSSGGGSSSYTALDGLIYNGSLLSDLSIALDPDGMPLADFERKYPNYAYLVPKLKTLKQFMGDISLENLEYLVRNEETIEEMNTELALDNTNAQEESKLYLGMLQSPEYSELCTALNAGGPSSDPLKGVLLDLMVEGAQAWAENFLGLDDLSALRGLLEKGTENAGRVAFKATRIIAKFIAKKNPIFNALSSMWKAKEVYSKISRVYKRLSGLWQNRYFVGIDKKLEKVYQSLKKNKLLGKLDVDDNGGLLTDSDKDQSVWNDLVTAFGKTPIPDGKGKGGLKFQADDFIFNWYPNSDTYNSPTIEILYKHPSSGNESTIVKIRF